MEKVYTAAMPSPALGVYNSGGSVEEAAE